MAVRTLTPELKKKAQEELGEDPQKLVDGIQHLKEWIDKQPHLRARKDEQWLAAFVRGCKFSLERAKEKIDLYYSLRGIAPDIYCLRAKDPKLIEILKSGCILILPKTASPDDPRVMMIRIGKYDPNKFTSFEVLAVPLILYKIMFIEDDNFVISGLKSIIDIEGSSLSQFSQMTPVKLKKLTIASQDASPIRMKGGHYLNLSPSFETLFNIAKSFLNEKNKKRTYVHSKVTTLYDHFSREILPAEYGGNGGTIQEIIDYWVKKVEDNRSWLDQDDELFGTDEKMRPGKPRTSEDLFGVDGSFRQLSFD